MTSKKSGQKSPVKPQKGARKAAGTYKHPGGRPSKYNADFHPKMAELMGQLGKTDKEISAELHISEVTLNTWKQEHPEFLKSLKAGKDRVDDLVENKLLQRAIGHTFTETKQYLKPLYDDEGSPVLDAKTGKQKRGLSREESTTKEILPDVTACIFWLKNRRSDRWRDKHGIEHSGSLDVLNMSDEELADLLLRRR